MPNGAAAIIGPSDTFISKIARHLVRFNLAGPRRPPARHEWGAVVIARSGVHVLGRLPGIELRPGTLFLTLALIADDGRQFDDIAVWITKVD